MIVMRALIQRSERTPFYLIMLASIMCLNMRVTNCDKDSQGDGRISVCDDGVTGIGEDLEDFQCRASKFNITTYDFPAGYSNCTVHTNQADHVCMSSPIAYNDTPPSSGLHRMIWPCYGEYDYCPPQRWIHSLEHGAVVFLYHPCTPDDQVTALKRLARSCLWRHIITSYPHLDQQYPMALVSWGCVYRMSWVDVGTAERWIKLHAFHSPEGGVALDGTYSHGLKVAAAVVSDAHDSKVCPKYHSVVVTDPKATTPTGSTKNNHIIDNVTTSSSHNKITNPSSTNTIVLTSDLATELPNQKSNVTEGVPSNNTFVVVHSSGGISVFGLTLLSGILALLLVFIMLCVLWRRYPPRKRYGRYKSFLPMSLQTDDGGIAIPTIGLPRSNKAEAEILIPEDEDDDEI